jgi:hypothetical protein
LYREAERLGIKIDGARVRATGGFDPVTWLSTGIDYEVEVASEASHDEVERLTGVVDDVAEIPKALRSGPPSFAGARFEPGPRHKPAMWGCVVIATACRR